jgi:hypothetical protein
LINWWFGIIESVVIDQAGLEGPEDRVAGREPLPPEFLEHVLNRERVRPEATSDLPGGQEPPLGEHFQDAVA